MPEDGAGDLACRTPIQFLGQLQKKTLGPHTIGLSINVFSRSFRKNLGLMRLEASFFFPLSYLAQPAVPVDRTLQGQKTLDGILFCFPEGGERSTPLPA